MGCLRAFGIRWQSLLKDGIGGVCPKLRAKERRRKPSTGVDVGMRYIYIYMYMCVFLYMILGP